MKALNELLQDRDALAAAAPSRLDFEDEYESDCPRCHGAGRYVVAHAPGHPEFGKAVLCRCAAERGRAPDRRDERLTRAHLPGPARTITFAGWDVARGGSGPLNAAQAYVSSWPPPKPFMVLTGTAGGGKTRLSHAIVAELFDRHHLVGQWWAVTDFLDRMRSTFDNADPAVTTESVERPLREAPLLVLDDLGKEKGTAYAQERLFALVDYRYREGLPLVVTTNVGKEDLPDALGSRVFSGYVVQCGRSDYRATQREVRA